VAEYSHNLAVFRPASVFKPPDHHHGCAQVQYVMRLQKLLYIGIPLAYKTSSHYHLAKHKYNT